MSEIEINTDNNDILIKNNVKLKHKRFPEERKSILKKIYNILELNEHNKRFSVKSVEEKNDLIMDLSDEILTYFSCSTWTAFKQNCNTKKKALSIVKSILNDLNVEYETVVCKVKLGLTGKYQINTEYIIKTDV